MATLTEEQQKIADLEAKVATLEADKVKLASDASKLEADKAKLAGDASKAVSELKLQLAAATTKTASLEAANAKQTIELEAAGKIVIDLKSQVAAAEALVEKLPQVSVGEGKYEVLTSFMYKGEEVTADVLKAKPELAAEIVREGISNLRKVVATKK